jgi:hypothetical protein
MNKLAIALAALTFVASAAGGARADSSGHASLNSLKWQMRQMRGSVNNDFRSPTVQHRAYRDCPGSLVIRCREDWPDEAFDSYGP